MIVIKLINNILQFKNQDFLYIQIYLVVLNHDNQKLTSKIIKKK